MIPRIYLKSVFHTSIFQTVLYPGHVWSTLLCEAFQVSIITQTKKHCGIVDESLKAAWRKVPIRGCFAIK